MHKRFFGAIVIAGAVILAGGTAAFAEDPGPYTPRTPKEPSLAGSSVGAVCLDNVPYIEYTVTLDDPDQVVRTDQAKLIISDATHRISVHLGTLTNGTLSGRVLWPGAEVTSDGEANGWPGWAYENGWVETSGNFAWTRGAISAELEVNPTMSVPLSYPGSTSTCDAPKQEVAQSSVLAVTGGTTGTLIAGGVIGGLLIAGGIGLTSRRRHRA